MDAITSVENEVDKVLRLFSDCREFCNKQFDQLIELLRKTMVDIDESSDSKYLHHH